MELKPAYLIKRVGLCLGLNRTFMELKLESGGVVLNLATVLIEPLWN